MYDTAKWTSDSLAEAQVMHDPDTRHAYETPASGWWILPGAVLGSLGWVGIFYVIFQ